MARSSICNGSDFNGVYGQFINNAPKDIYYYRVTVNVCLMITDIII